MLACQPPNLLPETNFREKIRCGEVYRNLNGNEMFQKFYYRCLECSMDFESSPEFEEHVIVHYLQEDEECEVVNANESKANHNIINISSGDEEEDEENDYLYAVEVASMVEDDISETDLPLPLMQMLSEQSADSCDQIVSLDDDDDEDEQNVAFPCEDLRRQALHQYSEPEKCCTKCPAYFNTKSDLNFHLHIHTLPNTVTCPHCYELYADIGKLNEHIRIRKKGKIRKLSRNNDMEPIRKKSKSQSNNSNSASPQSTSDTNELNNCTNADTDDGPDKNHKENVNATGRNSTNCNATIKRKEIENNDKCSAANTTTLLEINQTENSKNTSTNAAREV